jgi:hypothetical protein
MIFSDKVIEHYGYCAPLASELGHCGSSRQKGEAELNDEASRVAAKLRIDLSSQYLSPKQY